MRLPCINTGDPVNSDLSLSSNPRSMVAVGNTVFFVADDARFGTELWMSDGTEAGTRVFDLIPGQGSSNPYGLTVFEGTNSILFFANAVRPGDGGVAKGVEPMRATAVLGGGAWRVADIHVGANDSALPSHIVNTPFKVMGDHAYFTARNANNDNYELWRTHWDGTTGLVAEINIAPGQGSSPDHFAVVGRTLFYGATASPTQGRELWKTQVSALGVVESNVLAYEAFTEDRRSSDPRYLVTAGTTVFFSAEDNGIGRECNRSQPGIARDGEIGYISVSHGRTAAATS
jgi:ELWxxDGT repeat protein